MAVPAKRTADGQPTAASTNVANDITIAKRRDVVLKLGRAGQGTTNVLVSSSALALASPVFDAMFNGQFVEGQTRSPDTPREVPLPDDNPQAMLLICKIAHLKTSDLPKKLFIDAFVDFSLACDKYQCCEAVEAWSKAWVTQMLQMRPEANFEKAVIATYVLDLPEEFYKATTLLIRDRAADIRIIEADHIPIAIFEAMRSSKRTSEIAAYAGLAEPTKSLDSCSAAEKKQGQIPYCSRGCGYVADHSHVYLSNEEEYHFDEEYRLPKW